ncbi:MAG: hypothetical protein OEV44_00435 [Spirochaetota bacterium]|nr:hypothetical protein [Spirochaetota bacterium]
MSNLKDILNSSNILTSILSLSDKELFSNFKELSNLDFYLNSHGMSSKHVFTVIEHVKRILKNFALALKYRENPELMKKELALGTLYKKDFFRRVVKLIDILDLKPESNDFKVIVLTLLLHDIGKGSFDKTETEIDEEIQDAKKKGIDVNPDYFKLLYRTKGHEERGAFLVYSLLEEVEGVPQNFANRVKHLVFGHGDFSKLQDEKDFNFLVLLRRIMRYTTEYNYPIIHQPNPEELLIRELNINYLIFLFDIYGVDDQGKVWYSVKQEKETIYRKARWLLGQKLEDLLSIIVIKFSDFNKEKLDRLFKMLKKNFLVGFRTNTSFLLESELDDICSSKEKAKLLEIIQDYLSHTEKMFPLYLDYTSPQEKLLHIEMLSKANSNFNFHFTFKDKYLEITIVKEYAPEGTLLKIVRAIISSSIECGRTMKIIDLQAYSGEDDRLVDIITIKHINDNLTDNEINVLKKNLEICNDPNHKITKLELQITQEELDLRIDALKVVLNEVEIGSRKFQEIRVEVPFLSNLVLYSCLTALSYINIIDLKVEPINSHFAYLFLLSRRKQYKITSTSSFKNELIDQLNHNVVFTSKIN